MRIIIVAFLIASLCVGCSQSKKSSSDSGSKFSLKGSINGLQNEKLLVRKSQTGKKDTVIITNGKFVITGDYPIPTELHLSLLDSENSWNLKFFAENTDMIIESEIVDKSKNTKMTEFGPMITAKPTTIIRGH